MCIYIYTYIHTYIHSLIRTYIDTYARIYIYIYIYKLGLDQLAAQHPMSRHIRHIHNENRLNSDNLQHHAKWRGACWRREWLKAPSEPTQGVGMETAGGPAWARAHQGRPVPALAPGPANFAPEQGRALYIYIYIYIYMLFKGHTCTMRLQRQCGGRAGARI